jgi:membrane-bound ClpP family serine protease
MNENVEQQYEHDDLINRVINPDWYKVSSVWMGMGFTSILYGIVNPCIELLFMVGAGMIILSFIAYRIGNKGGKLNGKEKENS